MKFARIASLSLLLPAAVLAIACVPGSLPDVGAAVSTRTVELGPLRIDGIYRSMEGAFQRAALDTTGMGWITGFRTEVVEAATGRSMGDEFFCHSQLQLATGARLMVAATGIRELAFPAGFGIPIDQILGDLDAPWREVSLLGMVLNNFDESLDTDVKLRFLVDYVGTEAPEPVRRLYRASATILPDRPGVEVLEGEPLTAVTTPRAAHGKTGHWVVPPGTQVIRQRYRGLIPGDTRVHYAAVHLHHFGRSVELRNLTTGEVLWRTEAEYDGRGRIVQIPVYSSAEGFRMPANHEYELETVYRNTTDQPVDAMATMYLYHHPDGDRTMTYPPAPGAVPPSAGAGEAATDHSHH